MKHWKNRVLAIKFYDTFNKSAMKIFSVFSCGHIKFAICSTSLNCFENLVENPPFERPTQLWRSMRKTTLYKKASESPGWSSSLIGQKNIFLANQKREIQMLLELVR